MKLTSGGHLTFYMPEKQSSVDVPLNAPTPLQDILRQLRIPLEEIQLVARNGELVDLEEAIVSDTDVVRILSGVDGG